MSIIILNLVSVLQVVIGLVIMVTGFFHLVCGSDICSKNLRKILMVGLVGWGGWFGLVPLQGHPDSLPALAFSGLVCYVLIRHAHTIRELLGVEKTHEAKLVD